MKHYYIDGLHSQKYLSNFFCSKPENSFPGENLRFPMEKFHEIFSKGGKKNTLTDISLTNINDHLYKANNININDFNQIILAKPSEQCAVEAEKSLHSRAGASNSSNTATPAMGSAGTSDKEDKETGHKTATITVAVFDLIKTNSTDQLVLPPVDCLVVNSLLDVISRNLQEMRDNLRSLAKLLKPGGTFVYCGHLNATFYVIGGERFDVAKYNEGDLKSMLTKEGFVDISIEVSKAKAKNDLSDFDSVVFCTAHKKQTP